MDQNTNDYPTPIRIVRWLFPKVEMISTRLAGKFAKKLFFTPFRHPLHEQEQAILDKAKKFVFTREAIPLQGYEWGEDGPVVLLVHGWSGRASQLGSFVEPLVKQGYKVVAFDAPGHNASPGNYADLIYFSDCIQILAERFGHIHSIIAHSMGGAATMYALQQGLRVNNVTLIGSPAIASEIIQNFLSLINASKRIGHFVTDYIEETYGKPFVDYSALETSKTVHTPVLLVHDEEDKDVSVTNSKMLIKQLHDGDLLLTRGLGHVKILRDPGVIEQITHFLEASNAVRTA